MTRPSQPSDRLVDADPGDEIGRVSPFVMVGSPGLKRTAGYVNEEFLRDLSGRKGVRVYREMWDNSPMIAGWYMAVSELLRQIEWRVEPAANGRTATEDAEFLEQNMEDMEHSWGDLITEICPFVIYGWSIAELMYKRRVGPWERSRLKKSKFKDGKIGWLAIEGRSQETLLRWKFDPDGHVEAFVQMPPPRYDKRVLPMGKALLFRTTKLKNNPEGKSMLRGCYMPYYYLKRHMETEAIGVSRDLAGIPIARVPSKILSASPQSADGQLRAAIERLVKGVYRNEQEGILWPHDVDEETKLPLAEFELLSSGGQRQFNTDIIINRYKTEMLQALLSDFMQVGHENNGGSYALHTDKSGLFRTAINALAQRIADVFNRDAIPRLFELNDMRPDELPTIVPNNVDPPDLTQLGGFLQQTAAIGAQWFPDPELEKFIRDAAGLPKLSEGMEQVLELQQRQSAVLAVAQQRMQALQLDQQAAQGEMSTQQQAMGNAQQQQQLEAGPQEQTDPGDPDGRHAQAQAGETTSQAKVGTAIQQTKLAQEKAKLQQLKKPAPQAQGGKPAARKPVGKRYDFGGVR